MFCSLISVPMGIYPSSGNSSLSVGTENLPVLWLLLPSSVNHGDRILVVFIKPLVRKTIALG